MRVSRRDSGKVLGKSLNIFNRYRFENLNLFIKPLSIAIEQPVLERAGKGVGGSGVGGNVDGSVP